MCRRPKAYICNPLKNTKCKKTICGILNGDPISAKEDRCFLTCRKECRLELSDAFVFYSQNKTIEKWLDNYYGKEGEINGGDKWNLD